MFNLKLITRNVIFQIAFLILVALIAHAIVLKFIFPGYYSPLYPYHSDFYLSPAYANSPDISYLYLLGKSRSMNLIFLKLIGHFGIFGSTAVVIFLVCVNVALSAFLVKQLLKITFNIFFTLTFVGYCYLVFSQPYFYTSYSQDVGAQLSYFFLLFGACLFYFLINRSVFAAAGLLLLCCILGFLSKETYALSACFLAFIWFFYYRKIALLKAALPFIAVTISLVIIILINIHIKSIFVNLDSPADTPYKISFSPRVIYKEYRSYLLDAINSANCMLILLIALLISQYKGTQKQQFIFILFGCVFAMLLSILPNAILPNHHVSGYSFNGSYILYLPLLLIPIFNAEKIVSKIAVILIFGACLGSPLLNSVKYKSNDWMLIQENIERNLLDTLKPLILNSKQSSIPIRVLVVGITFPFSPFDHPECLRTFDHGEYFNFDVVKVDPPYPNQRKDLVQFIIPCDTLIKKYDQKWVFNSDGKMIEQKFFINK